MVAVQVRVSLILVLGATSFVRTLINLSTGNTGFDRHNIILANVQFRGAGGNESARTTSTEIYAGEHPAILKPGQWELVQNLLATGLAIAARAACEPKPWRC